MNMSIKKKLTRFLQTHPKTRQWLWFIFLWCVGLLSAMAIAFPVKVLIKLASAHQ
ncbi:hypothetical protein [Legionella fallonii]|uniref:hypothetical protein n=1 Tax=Legionella fallonii TaxID=96230 RepID=UPI000A6F4D7F|nr:hypothetical protein [Legionella fallonii]